MADRQVLSLSSTQSREETLQVRVNREEKAILEGLKDRFGVNTSWVLRSSLQTLGWLVECGALEGGVIIVRAADGTERELELRA